MPSVSTECDFQYDQLLVLCKTQHNKIYSIDNTTTNSLENVSFLFREVKLDTHFLH